MIENDNNYGLHGNVASVYSNPFKMQKSLIIIIG